MYVLFTFVVATDIDEATVIRSYSAQFKIQFINEFNPLKNQMFGCSCCSTCEELICIFSGYEQTDGQTDTN